MYLPPPPSTPPGPPAKDHSSGLATKSACAAPSSWRGEASPPQRGARSCCRAAAPSTQTRDLLRLGIFRAIQSRSSSLHRSIYYHCRGLSIILCNSLRRSRSISSSVDGSPICCSSIRSLQFSSSSLIGGGPALFRARSPCSLHPCPRRICLVCGSVVVPDVSHHCARLGAL